MLGFALLGEAWTPTANGPLMRRPKTVIKLPLENRDEFFNFLGRSNLGLLVKSQGNPNERNKTRMHCGLYDGMPTEPYLSLFQRI